MLTVGKHNDTKDSEFDPKELKMGIEVEKEHTDDPEVTKAIAKDHLVEISDYYSRLKVMEEEGKKAQKGAKKESATKLAFGSLVENADTLVDYLDDANARGFMARVPGSKFYKAPLKSPVLNRVDYPPSSDEVQDVLNDLKLKLRVLKHKKNKHEGSKKPDKSDTARWHQHKIMVDLVRNPNKRFLFSDPKMNDKEAEKILKENYNYTDAEISKLRQGSVADRIKKVAESISKKAKVKISQELKYDMNKLHERIAKCLGWTIEETKSLSLQTLRDLVRPLDVKLTHEITDAIENGY